MSRKTPYTKVEVVELRPLNAYHQLVRVNEVLINGKPVRVAKDGIHINYDQSAETDHGLLRDGIVSVTVELLVDEFSIKSMPVNE